MKPLLIMIFSLYFWSSYLKASVWDDVNFWSIEYENKYTEWIKSESLKESIFIDPKSPYYGIHTDCADTAYAFRAIFAYENRLPFAIKDPSGNRKNKLLTNRITKYDHFSSDNKKVVSMINDITEMLGSESLAHFDSYPISIKSINSGSLFLYKIDGNNNTFIRHTYIIKDVNDNGSFDVIYSTQSIKYSQLPLVRRKEKDFTEIPFSPWGFKRFKWPEHLNIPINQIPIELNASTEQYSLADQLGVNSFFEYVRKAHSKNIEENQTRFLKAFKDLCIEVQSRIEYVNLGVQYNEKIQHRCMSYEEYDSFSTPIKDFSLKTAFQKVAYFYNEAQKDGPIYSVPLNYRDFYEIIFENNLESHELLLKFCPIQYSKDKLVDLSEIWRRLNGNKLSSHPNDSLEARWGEDVEYTKCKTWY